MNVHTYPTMQAANAAAQELATASIGLAVPGIYYQQGGRNFVSSALPVRALLNMARTESARKGSDPSSSRNRPLETKHVNEIAEYLRLQDQYLLPPILLNAEKRLQICALETPSEIKPCIFVLPEKSNLFVTDGQHRLEAIRRCLELDVKPGLSGDAVGVTIIEEPELDKVHQDFFDAAQGKPLQNSLLVEYDGRDPLNWLTREVRGSAKILMGRTELIGNVGKNSLMMFTTNQIRNALIQLLVGDWSLFADSMRSQAVAKVTANPDLWKKLATAAIDEFTSQNEQWRLVAFGDESVMLSASVPQLREEYLHFTAAGLLVICGAISSLLNGDGGTTGELTQDQADKIAQLASLDWARRAELWAGYLVAENGKVQNNKPSIALAVAKAKRAIEVTLTKKEREAFEKAESPVPEALIPPPSAT